MLNRLIMTAIAAIAFLGLSAQAGTDILMTVGDTDVSVGEFKYIYEKNNGKTADYSQASLDEYLELYGKFKLKVAKAKEMQLDTIKALQTELAGYRSQLANSYLTDKEVMGRLIDEMYERQQEDVRLSHILIKVRERDPNKKKEEAIKKLLNIKQQLREGKSFAALAKEYSQDTNSKSRGGDMGYVTASLPNGFYNLENVMYGLDVNEVSEPIQTKLGYHLVKITDKRPARGTIEVAHIFKKLNKKDRSGQNAIKKTMDSIYNALQGGADFGTLANQYSDDKTTKTKGGKLPSFGISTYDSKFEDAAFALKRTGDYTKPVLTSVGYHIIKKINKPGLPTKEELKFKFKGKAKKTDRYTDALASMIDRIKETSQFRERRNVLDKFTAGLAPEFYTYKWIPRKEIGEEVLFSFGDANKQSIYDFAKYAKKKTRLRGQFDQDKPLPEGVEVIYQEFIKEKAYEYAQANLENKYPEFKSLMREYEEGILLFEATKINVWDKANTDTVGLYNFYEQNKSKYIFEQQATIGEYIVKTTDEKQIKKIMKCAKRHNAEKTMKRFNKDGVEMVEYTESKVEPGSKELIGLEFKKKSISKPIIDTKNGLSLFKKVVKIEESRRKSLAEARGYVVADYQDQLEQKWVNQLKKQYPIKVSDSVYKSLIKK